MLRTLRRGWRGPDVSRWQQFLGGQGLTNEPIDGIFSAKTEQATRSFQESHGLQIDGVVGPQTYAAAAPLGLRSVRRLTNAELTPALIREARRILAAHHADPYGTEVGFHIDGTSYFGRIEEHYHPPGGPRRPWGEHPGVSLFLDSLPDRTVTLEDERRADAVESDGPEAVPIAVTGVVVLDPGHGGADMEGGSSPNNARSPTGLLEKTLTLEMALLIRDELERQQSTVVVVLTRSTDVNVGLETRARRARQARADIFLSLHFNGFNGTVRGVEAHIRPKAGGNVNHAEDERLADGVCRAVHAALFEFDAATPLRGVKESNLGVLRDDWLGNSGTQTPTRACLLEFEFLDVPAVDHLFNSGPQAPQVRERVARAVAAALVRELA